jgi:endonuclease/exonuclease/phosphatase family metal-dependent hydrolase
MRSCSVSVTFSRSPTATTGPLPDTLHLAAWNINHRTGRKSIPPDTLHAIAALDSDVLVLTEFVDGDHHARFKESLKDIGYSSLAVSLKAPHQNQILIAARTPLADDGLLPLPGYTEAATTNWLRRRLPALKLEIVGLRAPVDLNNDVRLGYWPQVSSIAQTARERRVVFLGDFNLDPHADTRPGTQVFPRLVGALLPCRSMNSTVTLGSGERGARSIEIRASGSRTTDTLRGARFTR